MPGLKDLIGRWKVIESENFDALFEKMGTLHYIKFNWIQVNILSTTVIGVGLFLKRGRGSYKLIAKL